MLFLQRWTRTNRDRVAVVLTDLKLRKYIPHHSELSVVCTLVRILYQVSSTVVVVPGTFLCLYLYVYSVQTSAQQTILRLIHVLASGAKKRVEDRPIHLAPDGRWGIAFRLDVHAANTDQQLNPDAPVYPRVSPCVCGHSSVTNHHRESISHTPTADIYFYLTCIYTYRDHRCQETCQARQNMRCQGCTAECSTLKPSSVVSVKACQGKIAVCQGVKMLSPDIFAR